MNSEFKSHGHKIFQGFDKYCKFFLFQELETDCNSQSRGRPRTDMEVLKLY